MADGFLGRWSQRKLDVQAGRPVVEPPPPPPAPDLPAPVPAVQAAEPQEPQPAAPPPTLEEVAELTPDSDFSRFAASDVAPEVRNAAMKKLFADPHFNVMDGLDIYIDDYGLPDPLPERMLRSLASAEFLGLFPKDDKDKSQAEQDAGKKIVLSDPAAESVAQWRPDAEPAPEPNCPDADPDLRLQQDPAPGPQGPGDGAR